MDAVTSNGQQNYRQHRTTQRKESRPDPLAHIASRIASLSTDIGALPLWSDIVRQIREARFAVKFVTLYDFVGKCPRPANGERDVALEFVRRHWEEKVISQITNQRPAKDAEDAKKIALSLALRFAAHLRMAAMVSVEDFLAKRVEIERAYMEAGKEIPAKVLEQIAFTDRRSIYTMEQLVAAGFKRSFAQEGLYKDPITGAEISVGGRKPTNDDRRGRHSFSRRNDDMLSHFGNAEEREHKHKKIPVLTREEQEANRLAKIEGRLARRVAAHKAAADRKQQQAAAKKAASEKKGGGKRKQG